jgi:hypothetical protein
MWSNRTYVPNGRNSANTWNFYCKTRVSIFVPECRNGPGPIPDGGVRPLVSLRPGRSKGAPSGTNYAITFCPSTTRYALHSFPRASWLSKFQQNWIIKQRSKCSLNCSFTKMARNARSNCFDNVLFPLENSGFAAKTSQFFNLLKIQFILFLQGRIKYACLTFW